MMEEKLTDLEYWKQRCKLMENIEAESPRDPGITKDQIEAWNKFNTFRMQYGDR